MQPNGSERAILVGVDLKGRGASRAPARPPAEFDTLETSTEESLNELAVLAGSAGATVLDKVVQVRDAARASTLIGSGKVEELKDRAEAEQADLVIFDHELSPTQLRNLESALGLRVIDRTQLILDIFASRARTREGQLQVELAQLSYLLPRLTGRGTQMSRLGGGIGTRGPGETQLETDRRRIALRMKKIKEDLAQVRAGRTIQRRQRQAVPLSTISLVGYTNAGKSTLFNRLTGSGVVADARMFATLDPTVRHLVLPSNRRTLLSDTVGFIRNLPTTLVEAFRATLEEVTEAALLLHVVDVSSATAAQETAHVLKVLAEIGAGQTPQLLVLNKIDRLPQHEGDAEEVKRRIVAQVSTAETRADWNPPAVSISARTGEGMARLLQTIDQVLPIDPVSEATFRFPAAEGGVRYMLHEFARVKETRYEGDTCIIEADAPQSIIQRLSQYVERPQPKP